MSRKREPQLTVYFDMLEQIIPREDDLDAVIGYSLVTVINAQSLVKNVGREFPFEVMPQIYSSLSRAIQQIVSQPNNDHAAYHLACDLLKSKELWHKFPSGRGTIEERIARAGRFLREDVQRRGDLTGTKNAYLGDFSLLIRYFEVKA